jgi:hypothetical protein
MKLAAMPVDRLSLFGCFEELEKYIIVVLSLGNYDNRILTRVSSQVLMRRARMLHESVQ